MTRTVQPCPVPDCPHTARVGMLCVSHWSLVPDAMRAAIQKAFRSRWRGGRYEADYTNAVRAAVRLVRHANAGAA